MKEKKRDAPAKISRSPGIGVCGYVVGGGWRGFSSELDNIVVKEAELLRDHYGVDVTIRYNSDRLSGGAWLIDSPRDGIGANNSIGLGASLVNSKLRAMPPEELTKLAAAEFQRLRREADTIIFSTHIDLKKTEHCVPPDSRYILLDSEHRDFRTLEEAAGYLKTHAFGLKHTTEEAEHERDKKTGHRNNE